MHNLNYNEILVKFQNEDLEEFLKCAGVDCIIDTIADEHSDTYFYSDLNLAMLEGLHESLKTSINVLNFKEFEGVFKKHNFDIKPFLESNAKSMLDYQQTLKRELKNLKKYIDILDSFKMNLQFIKLQMNKVITENKKVLKNIFE